MKRYRHLAPAFALCALFLSSSLPASASDVGDAGAAIYTIDPVHSEVTFQVRHLLTKVRGRFQEFEGTIERAEEPAESSVVFTIRTDSIDTGNERRDNHLRSPDFFDAASYPTIEFRSSKVVATGERTFEVMGILDMHGVEKEINLPVTFLGEIDFGDDVRAGFETATTLDRKAWDIIWNRALDQGSGLLGENVAVEINLEVVKKP